MEGYGYIIPWDELFVKNNIKECDIIKTISNMIAFGCGLSMGIMYHMYQEDIVKYMKKATKKVESIK